MLNDLSPPGLAEVWVPVSRNEHTVAITAMEVFSWGSNDCGQCGRDDEGGSLPPGEIRSLSKAHVVQVVCGLRHTLCVTATSQVNRISLLPTWTSRPKAPDP